MSPRQPRPSSQRARRWMVAYDIADDRRRRRVAAILEGYGERVQKSVFECTLNTAEVHAIRDRIAKVIAPDDDGVRLYPMCVPCSGRTRQQGAGPIRDDDGFTIE